MNKLEDNVQSLSKKPDIQMSDLLLKVQRLIGLCKIPFFLFLFLFLFFLFLFFLFLLLLLWLLVVGCWLLVVCFSLFVVVVVVVVLVQSQVRFNRVSEKVPEKVPGSLVAKPSQVQGAPKKVAEAKPGQVHLYNSRKPS